MKKTSKALVEEAMELITTYTVDQAKVERYTSARWVFQG